MKEQLFITEFDIVDLPQEYHFSHNVTVRLYDDLVEILKDKNVLKKLTIKVTFSENEKRPRENEKNILAWLSKNGKEEFAEEIISTHTTFALVSDLCHFIFQALNSAKKYKLSVAYSLIRKPFLENLVLLEELLVNEKDFLKKFESNPEAFDPGKLNDTQKKYLIEESLKKIKSPFFDSELIYELRFDKNSPKGIYAMSNLATHLVTTRHPVFKTESRNLNFIFSRSDEWEEQLSHFYYFMPYILYYTVEIIDRYLYNKKIINSDRYRKRQFYRLISQALHHDQYNVKSIKANSTTNKLSRFLKVKCKSCEKTNQLFKSDLYSLINNDYILCKHCLIDLYFENNSLDEIIKKFRDL